MIDLKKKAARQAAAARRKQAHSADRQARAAARLAEWSGMRRSGGPVAGYLAITTEIDPIDVMTGLHGTYGRKICVPVITGEHAPLLFREWMPDTELKTGQFRVPVPVSGEWLTPEIVIVPLLAFDRRGCRLGYGGGYYDRTLRQLRNTGQMTAVGMAFAAQETENLPVDEFDQKLDAVVTEKEILQFTSAAEKWT